MFVRKTGRIFYQYVEVNREAVGSPLTRTYSAQTPPPAPPRSLARSLAHNLYGSFVTFILNGVCPARPPFGRFSHHRPDGQGEIGGRGRERKRERGRERARERERERELEGEPEKRRERERDANNSQRDVTAPSPARAQSAEWNNKRGETEEGGREGEMADPSRPGRGELPATLGPPHPTPGAAVLREGRRFSMSRGVWLVEHYGNK